jgi:hypothetical protein
LNNKLVVDYWTPKGCVGDFNLSLGMLGADRLFSVDGNQHVETDMTVNLSDKLFSQLTG